MDCIFCGEKETVKVVHNSGWGMNNLHRAECEFCGAQGQLHSTAEAAAQEWQALIKKAPAASPTIEELSAGVLQQVIDEGRATQFITDVGRCREALSEFDNFYSLALSQFTDGWESRQSDDRVVWGWNDANLTIGMFRKARVALGNVVEEMK